MEDDLLMWQASTNIYNSLTPARNLTKNKSKYLYKVDLPAFYPLFTESNTNLRQRLVKDYKTNRRDY